YAQNGTDLFVNLFINSNSSVTINGQGIDIEQQNNYPWNGDLKFIVSPKKGSMPFSLKVRIPGWASGQAIPSDLYSYASKVNDKIIITVNGTPVEYNTEKGYAVLNRTWKKNDVVEVNLPMEVRRVKANNKLKEDIGKIALQRGPLMYCAEWPDNNGSTSTIILPASAQFTTEFEPALLNGVTVLKSQV